MKEDDFRKALEAGDVRLVTRMAAAFMPHIPQPKSPEAAEIQMHYARTTVETVSLKARAYSHRWLTERNLPSGLPDNLKPAAERLYPVIATAVGISVKSNHPWIKPVASQIERAMSDAVLEAEADGRLEDTVFVKERMAEARERTYRQLLGR